MEKELIKPIPTTTIKVVPYEMTLIFYISVLQFPSQATVAGFNAGTGACFLEYSKRKNIIIMA
jgi:hypothetical protein